MTGHTAAIFNQRPAMGCVGCDASRTLKIAAKWSFLPHRVAGPLGHTDSAIVAGSAIDREFPVLHVKMSISNVRYLFMFDVVPKKFHVT